MTSPWQLSGSVGIEVRGGMFTPLIARGTRLPCAREEIFTTGDDGQPSILVRVFLGDADRVAENRSLGTFEIRLAAPAPRGIPQIAVTFAVDDAERFSLTARDCATGAELAVERRQNK